MISRRVTVLLLLLVPLLAMSFACTARASGGSLSDSQKATEVWMGQEAVRKVKAYNFTVVSLTKASLPQMRAWGTAVRVLPGNVRRTWNWEVKFHVAGSGSTRRLVAESPIFK